MRRDHEFMYETDRKRPSPWLWVALVGWALVAAAAVLAGVPW